MKSRQIHCYSEIVQDVKSDIFAIQPWTGGRTHNTYAGRQQTKKREKNHHGLKWIMEYIIKQLFVLGCRYGVRETKNKSNLPHRNSDKKKRKKRKKETDNWS